MKRPLSRSRILEAALVVVDRDGLERLTMRALGAELGVQAMSLYRYFPSKSALLSGLHDIILAELDWQETSSSWPVAIERLARAFRSTLASHPNAIPIFSRPAETDRTLDTIETLLLRLEADGIPPQTALHIFQVVLAFVVGHALWQYSPDGVRDVDEEFDFGLEALIIGIQAKVGG